MPRVAVIVVVVVTLVCAQRVSATIPPPSSAPSESILLELVPAAAPPSYQQRSRPSSRQRERRPAAAFPKRIGPRLIELPTPNVRPVLVVLPRETPRLDPVAALTAEASFDLPSSPSVVSPMTAVPTVRTIPRTRAFHLPETAIEFLLGDRSLVPEQRGRLDDAIAQHEERRRAYRESLRAELQALEHLLRAELDATSALQIVRRLAGQRRQERRLMRVTFGEIHSLLSPDQWHRLADWIRRHPSARFHRHADGRT